jgi:hypothetical protein
MKGKVGLSSLAAGGMILPLVRPLPVIYAYAEALERLPGERTLGPRVRADFRSHVNALVETVAALPPPGVPRRDRLRLKEAARHLLRPRRGADRSLIPDVNALTALLESFSRKYRKELRDAFTNHAERLRGPYGRKVRPRVLGLIRHNEDPQQTDRLVETLTNRCQYVVRELPSFGWPQRMRSWILCIAPTDARVPDDLVERASRTGKPVVALLKSRPSKERGAVTPMRAAYGLARRGVELVHPPYNALRLIQILDPIAFRSKLG